MIFVKKNNVSIDLFEIARIGKGEGTGDRKTLYGPQNVKNKNCIYVIKI